MTTVCYVNPVIDDTSANSANAHGILQLKLFNQLTMATPNLLVTGPGDCAITIVLAHGAGGAMDTKFMNHVSDGLAEHGLRTVRFEFPYMAKRREDGKKRGPDQQKLS